MPKFSVAGANSACSRYHAPHDAIAGRPWPQASHLYRPETMTRKEGGTCLWRGLAVGLTQGLTQLASTPPMDGR